jgi:hypothetical protein
VNVDEVLKGLDPRLKGLAESLRKVIKRSLPEAVEQVKWGSPVYSVNGKNVACIMCYSDHVNLGFYLGAKLVSSRLEGTGKGLRHVKIRDKSDIDEKEFDRLLRRAAALVE